MIVRNNNGAISVLPITLLISSFIIASTVGTVLFEETKANNEINYEQMVDETLGEISTYIQIKGVLGKYNDYDDVKYIDKIAILVSPLISTDLDLSEMFVEINNGGQLNIFKNSGLTNKNLSHNLFENPIWNKIDETSYGFIAINDRDNSIDGDILNKNTDIAYMIFKLTNDLKITKGDILDIKFLLPSGIIRCFSIEAPMPMKNVVYLD